MKYPYCEQCRNYYPDLVSEVVRQICCEHCKGVNMKRKDNKTSNFEPVRDGRTKNIPGEQIRIKL